MVWANFLIAAAALKTPARHGYNAQGGNLVFPEYLFIANQRADQP